MKMEATIIRQNETIWFKIYDIMALWGLFQKLKNDLTLENQLMEVIIFI